MTVSADRLERADIEESSATRTWGVRLVTLGLILGLLSGQSKLIGLPLGPDRPLIAAGIALLLLSDDFRGAGRLRWRPVHTLMVAMVAWTFWSALGHKTLLTERGAFGLLDILFLPFLLFALAPLIYRTTADRRLLLKALILVGLYLGITAILEVLGPQSLVFPRYIMNPDVGIHFGRARGPGLSAEANGMVLAAALFACILALTRLTRWWRILALAVMPLCAIGMTLTLTRSVWLGGILGLLAVFVVSPALRRWLPALVAAGLAVVGAVLVAFPAVTRMVTDRLTRQDSVYDRANTNEAALRMIVDHPFTGVGWTRFIGLSADYVRQADTYPVTQVTIDVHNVVLGRAAELGLIGAALWVGCLVAGPLLAVIRVPARDDLAQWRLFLIGFGCVWGVAIMVSPVPYALPNNLLWLVAGMVLRDYLITGEHEEATPAAAEPAGTT